MREEGQKQNIKVEVKKEEDNAEMNGQDSFDKCDAGEVVSKPDPCAPASVYPETLPSITTGRPSGLTQLNTYPHEHFQHTVDLMVATGGRGANPVPYNNMGGSVDLRLGSKADTRGIEPGEVLDSNSRLKAAEHVHQKEFENPSLADINLQPLAPVLLHDRTQQYLHDHYHQMVSAKQYYESDVNRWEQENQRYADISWKAADGYLEDAYPGSHIINSHGNDADYVSANSQASDSFNDCGSDVYCHSSYFSDSSCSAPTTGHGRRRRKRVQTPGQRTAANLRERRRMCHLNVAFDKLKEHLPNVKDKKKLSRIQTLKAAIYYIHLLKNSLSTDS